MHVAVSFSHLPVLSASRAALIYDDCAGEKGSDNPQQYLCDFLEELHLPLRSNTDTRVEVELQERLFATACVYSHLPQRPTVITIPPTLGPCTLTLLTARRNDKRARGELACACQLCAC